MVRIDDDGSCSMPVSRRGSGVTPEPQIAVRRGMRVISTVTRPNADPSHFEPVRATATLRGAGSPCSARANRTQACPHAPSRPFSPIANAGGESMSSLFSDFPAHMGRHRLP